MNHYVKKQLTSLAVIAGAAGLLLAKSKIDCNERMKTVVERPAFDLAQGNDVYLFRDGNRVLFTIGANNWNGVYLHVEDTEGDGVVDKYNLYAAADCRGDDQFRQYGRNILRTALGESKVCEREVALLRLADRDILNRIERELLPYSGKNEVVDGTQP